MANPKRKTSIAALAAALPASGQAVQLLPAGVFRAADGSGRPADAPHWKIDAAGAARLIARVAARANPLVIDYEHQTLYTEKNGQPAPAAGWFAGSALEWRDGAGLFASVDWTPVAAGRIADGEYRYISPVFEYDRATGEVVDLRMAALTNNPGLHGMAAVALTALNDFSHQEDSEVNETLKKLLAAIGLADNAAEADALAAVAALKAKAESADGMTTQIAALKAANPDPAKFVAVETMQQLQTQVAALSARLNDGEVGEVVEAALTAGKLLPAQKDWATDLGKSNLAALKAYVEKTPAIAALGGLQTNGKDPAGDKKPGELADNELAVCKAMGLSTDEFLKSKAAA
ncbi:MAG TPA: phage protease [Azonexus sp.]|nr:phage protease [Azonexus sp.]